MGLARFLDRYFDVPLAQVGEVLSVLGVKHVQLTLDRDAPRRYTVRSRLQDDEGLIITSTTVISAGEA